MSEQSAPTMSVFNTPLECGLRSACLLLAAFPESCDLQRLVQYDYLVVHSGDVEGGPPSIHPATPNRSGELLVRRSLVEQGLEFMVERRVVERSFSTHGFMYSAGEYAAVFLDAVKAQYIVQLRQRADWVVQQFQQMSDEDLAAYMQERWSHWGAEFVRESLLEMTEE
ncbi:MAG: ABC-three component system middle component 2 [Planctomycetaceae bacterium]